MSILSLGIWIVGIIGLLAVGFSLLPDASSIPYPDQITESINAVWSYIAVMNELLPVNTALTIFLAMLGARFFIHIVWPSILWFLKYIRGSTGS